MIHLVLLCIYYATYCSEILGFFSECVSYVHCISITVLISSLHLSLVLIIVIASHSFFSNLSYTFLLSNIAKAQYSLHFLFAYQFSIAMRKLNFNPTKATKLFLQVLENTKHVLRMGHRQIKEPARMLILTFKELLIFISTSTFANFIPHRLLLITL